MDNQHRYNFCMSCTLNSENFNGKSAGDAYLDGEWKCRSCHLFAGQHPAPPVQHGM